MAYFDENSGNVFGYEAPLRGWTLEAYNQLVASQPALVEALQPAPWVSPRALPADRHTEGSSTIGNTSSKRRKSTSNSKRGGGDTGDGAASVGGASPRPRSGVGGGVDAQPTSKGQKRSLVVTNKAAQNEASSIPSSALPVVPGTFVEHEGLAEENARLEGELSRLHAEAAVRDRELAAMRARAEGTEAAFFLKIAAHLAVF